MNAKKTAILLSCILCSLIACDEADDPGLPDKILIPREGGVIHLENHSGIYGIGLQNSNGEAVWDKRYRFPPDYDLPASFDTITCDWLKVVHPWDSTRTHFYFIAEPNNTGKKRKMTFNGMVWTSSFHRTVEQAK